MKLRVVIQYDPDIESYSAYCPELQGFASAGDTSQEALVNIKEAMALYLEPSPVKISSEGKVFEVEVSA